MGVVAEVPPAALVAGILYADAAALDEALGGLDRLFGPVEMESADFAFDMTDYYTVEMGGGLVKRFVCFARPVAIDRLPDIKLETNALETATARPGGDRPPARRVNIDPGYVTLAKLVLATTKDYSHRVYLGKGIFAEATLRFIGGTFVPFENTYPDYRTKPALEFFNRVREFVKRNIGEWTRANASKS